MRIATSVQLLLMTDQIAQSDPALPSPNAEGPSDDELMGAIQTGSKDAFGKLYDRHVPNVYALCLKILHRDSEAEAVVSDVFLEVWRKPGNFDTSRGTFRTYLLTLARSRAIDRWRATATRTRITQEASSLAVDNAPRSQLSHEPSRLAVLSERQLAVRAAIEKLDEPQHKVLQLAYFEGLTHREISEQLDMPLGTVKTRIRHGLKTLKKTLSSLGDLGGL